MTRRGLGLWAVALAGAALPGCASDPQRERAEAVERDRRRAEGVALAQAWQYAYAPQWAASPTAPVRVVGTGSSGYSAYVAPTWNAPPRPVRYVAPQTVPTTWSVYSQPRSNYVGTSSRFVASVPPSPQQVVYVTPVPVADRVQRIRDLDARIDAASTRIAALRVRTVRTTRYDERVHWLESVRDAARQDVTALRDGLPRSPTFDEAEARVRTLEDYVDSEGRAIAEGR